jgi:hypothetical protein
VTGDWLLVAEAAQFDRQRNFEVFIQATGDRVSGIRKLECGMRKTRKGAGGTPQIFK